MQLLDFNMKFFIALFICVVAVSGQSNNEEIDDLLRRASNTCVELQNRDQRFYLKKGRPTDPCLVHDPNFLTCIYQIIGVMKGATFSLKRMLSLAVTPEEKKSIVEIYNTTMKQCASKVLVGKNPCKMTACVLDMPKSLCGSVPNDGC